MPRTQANYDSLVALLKRILAATSSGTGGKKKIASIHRLILDWKVPDASEIISPHTQTPEGPEDLNPRRAPRAKVQGKKKAGPRRKGPAKRQVSKGGILLPGDPLFDVRAASEASSSP